MESLSGDPFVILWWQSEISFNVLTEGVLEVWKSGNLEDAERLEMAIYGKDPQKAWLRNNS